VSAIVVRGPTLQGGLRIQRRPQAWRRTVPAESLCSTVLMCPGVLCQRRRDKPRLHASLFRLDFFADWLRRVPDNSKTWPSLKTWSTG
jgi:hypothetical protein